MLESLLIANRGEIARRIIRTARRLGVRTIAVHSHVDRNALFVREADEAFDLGGATPRESYLDADKILAAARRTHAAAIHPGYGFLSENAQFAEAVEAAGLIWVGAPAAAITAMGRKDAAKKLMMVSGVPVTPGYLGDDQNPGNLYGEAARIGYPVMIKAVAGGGGKGMRRVARPGDFLDELAACRREAATAFGNDAVLLERCIDSPRHIEVQVFGDRFGQVVHLFERDCSLQRRHQKIIEEAPAPGMDDATRAALCAEAVAAAKAVRYIGAGTVEFIADAAQGLRADHIWFMEMNTRLQVEHPVTEQITGQDLVEWQLRIASGEALPLHQGEISIDGWAMEARLYAENPLTGFLPSTGTIRHLHLPEGIRVDSGVATGDEVSGHYDALLAKLIVHASDRPAAAARLARACAEVEIWPVHSNAALLARLASEPAFVAGTVDTGFIERHAATLLAPPKPSDAIVRAAARALLPSAPDDPWSALAGWRGSAAPFLEVPVEIDDHVYYAAPAESAGSRVVCIDDELLLFAAGNAWCCREPTLARSTAAHGHSDGALIAPMPGRIASVAAQAGQAVTRGQRLVVLEAMKMEHAMTAPFDGIVAELPIREGEQVTEGTLLVRVQKETE
ncbi:MAG: acetyl/propionyl/methylcrotonyl-CoA carboxylase subunit alpha [Steroidobacterales bacterium]